MTHSANTTYRTNTNTNTTETADKPRQKIVVGYDGSSSARAALRRGMRLAPRLETDLVIVASWHYPTDVSASGYGDWSPQGDAEAMIREVVTDEFPNGSPTWLSTVVSEGRAAEVLLAQSRGAEMLIVGSRGHGGFAGLLLGSVSTACAEHAECPVLVMHGDRDQAEPEADQLPLATALG